MKDSISKKVEEGISGCDFFCLVISTHLINSKWVEQEYRNAYAKKMSSGTPIILPLLVQDVKMPFLSLEDIKYADFSREYDSGLICLLNDIEKQ
jgi:hypothetical protein